MRKILALGLSLLAAIALGWSANQTPAPKTAQAPADAFSAGRAMIDDRVIARTPHPIGSAANAAVRDYLLLRMRTEGLSPRVQRAEVIRRTPRSKTPVILGATVENLVGVLPGQDPTAPALVLMTHYDSVPGSPGAADDAAGVSAALEIIRAIKLEGPPVRDVILLITDGEEAGLLGAEGFFGQDPLARHAGIVLNMETRGGGGLAQMFQTGPGNGALIDLFAKASNRPASSSLAVYLYSKMPNDTDFTVSRAAGLTGLNLAFIGRQFDYHAPSSTSDNLEQGSLQHMGDQALAATRAIAFAKDLPKKGGDAVYANTFGKQILAYPLWAGWGVLILAAGLLALGLMRHRQAGRLIAPDILRGSGAAVYLLLVSAGLMHLIRRGTGAGYGFLEQRQLLAQVTRWEIALLLVGLGALLAVAGLAGRARPRLWAIGGALVLGALPSVLGTDMPALVLGLAAAAIGGLSFDRKISPEAGWAGVLMTGVIAGTLLQALAPATAFLIVWPLTLASLGFGLSSLGRSPGSLVRILPVALISIPALGWLLGFAHGIFLGLDLPELLGLFVWIAAMLVWPLADAEAHDLKPLMAGLGLIVAGLTVTAMVRFLPPWTARHPQATLISYVVDAGTGKAQRVSSQATLPAWTKNALIDDGGPLGKVTLPILDKAPLWSAPTRSVPFEATDMTLTLQPDGNQSLHIQPPAGVSGLSLDIQSDTLVSGTKINGQAIALFDKPGQWARVRLSAMPQGVTLTFRPVGPGRITVRYGARTDSWPATAKPLPSRNKTTMPFLTSDTMTVTGTQAFSF